MVQTFLVRALCWCVRTQGGTAMKVLIVGTVGLAFVACTMPVEAQRRDGMVSQGYGLR